MVNAGYLEKQKMVSISKKLLGYGTAVVLWHWGCW